MFLTFGCLFPRQALAQRTLSGTISFDSVNSENHSVPALYPATVTMVFSATDGSTYFGRTVSLTPPAGASSTFTFSVTDLPEKAYRVWVKGYKWLASVKNADLSMGDATLDPVTLRSGDANDDNMVDIADVGLLFSCYGAQIGAFGYDDRCDFTCDGNINLVDFAAITNYFSVAGDTLDTDPLASIVYDAPVPDYAAGVVPMDTVGGGDEGPSAADAVNLTSGVYENLPGADIYARNPVGADPAYVRTYHSGRASQNYSSPGLSAGWTDNYDHTILALNSGGTWGPLLLFYPNGALDMLQPMLDPQTHQPVLTNGVATISTPAKVPYTASGVPDPNHAGGWLFLTLTFADQSQLIFEGSNNRYRLTRQVNGVGHALIIGRDASSGRIQTISNDDTRPNAASLLLQFHYAGNLLRQIDDVQGERSVYYQYAGNQLAQVTQLGVLGGAVPNFLWVYNYLDTTAQGNATSWPLLNSVSVVDPSQFLNARTLNTIHYESNGSGRVASLEDANHHVHQYTYLPANGQAQVQVLSDTTMQATVTDVWTQTYSRNRDTGMTHATQSTSVYYYDPANPYLPTDMVDPNGNSTSLTYDGYGNVTEIDAPLNDSIVTTTFTYDNNPAHNVLGWLTSVQVSGTELVNGIPNPVSKTPTKLTYYLADTFDMNNVLIGKKGQMQKVETPVAGSSGQNAWVATTFTYTALGNIKTITAPLASDVITTGTVEYLYDSDPNFTLAPLPLNYLEAVGEPVAINEPFDMTANVQPGHNTATRTLHYRYDTRGNLALAFSPMSGLVTTERTDYIYNIADQLLMTVLPRSRPNHGRAVAQTDYVYPGGPAYQSTFYDDVNDNSYNTFYSPQLGNLQASTPQTPHPIRQVQTQYGKEAELKGVTGSTTEVSFDYDSAYRTTALKDGRNHASLFHYNSLGELDQHTWPGGKSVLLGYDGPGNLTSFTNARDHTANAATPTAQFHYSGDHTVLSSIEYAANSGLSNVAYTYDGFGRVASATDATTKLEYTYDDLDHLMSTTTTYIVPGGNASAAPPAQEISYTYYPDGSLKTRRFYPLVNGTGPRALRQANPNDWIIDTMQRGLTCPIPPPVVTNTTTFNPLIEAPRTLTDKYRHDLDGHMTGEQSGAHNSDCPYGDACQLASILNTILFCDEGLGYNCHTPFDVQYLPSFDQMNYDSLGHLLSYRVVFPQVTLTDEYSQATHTVTPMWTASFLYDDQHNDYAQNRDRLAAEALNGMNMGRHGDETPTYFTNTFALDASDNLTTVRDANHTYSFNNASSDADNQIDGFTYDADGNLLVQPGATCTYDAANHLTSYTYKGVTLTFGYRPDGLLAWKQVGNDPATRTYFFYESGHLVYEMSKVGSSWQLSRYYRWTPTGLVQSWNAVEGMVDYIYDPQGNVLLRYTEPRDATTHKRKPQWEDVSATRFYDAYGKLRKGSAASDPVGYNGRWGYYTDVPADATSNAALIYCASRYYSPDLARWLTRDPIGYEGGLNVYAYCDNNPVGQADSSGLQAVILLTGEEAATVYGTTAAGTATAAETGLVIESIAEIGLELSPIGIFVNATAAASLAGYCLSSHFLAPLVGTGHGALARTPAENNFLKARRQSIRAKAAAALSFPDNRLEHMFKAGKGVNHAMQFDSTLTNVNTNNKAKLIAAIRAFVMDDATEMLTGNLIARDGTVRTGTHYFNRTTGLWIFVSSNNFFVGWALSSEQLTILIKTGVMR